MGNKPKNKHTKITHAHQKYLRPLYYTLDESFRSIPAMGDFHVRAPPILGALFRTTLSRKNPPNAMPANETGALVIGPGIAVVRMVNKHQLREEFGPS